MTKMLSYNDLDQLWIFIPSETFSILIWQSSKALQAFAIHSPSLMRPTGLFTQASQLDIFNCFLNTHSFNINCK
jgi:hypothetical protein